MQGRTLKRAAMVGTALCALALGGCSMFDDPQGAGEIAGRAAPGTTPASVTVSTVLSMAEQTRASGDLGSAIGFYRRAISMDPSQAKAYAGLGETLNMAGAPNDAVEAFRAGLANAPNDPDLLRGYGFSLLALNQPEGAVERFQKSLAFSKDARTYGGLGVAQDLLSDYTAAEASYNAALALDPHNINLRNNLGLSQALAGKYDEAIETLHAVAADGAAGPRQRLNLALVLGLAGRTEEAAQVARIDLDERSVRSNIAYYLSLRALPPDVRAQALLNPGSKPVVHAKGEVKSCASPPCDGQTSQLPESVSEKPAGGTQGDPSGNDQPAKAPQKLAAHPVTQVKSAPVAAPAAPRTASSKPAPEVDPVVSADRNEHANVTASENRASSSDGSDAATMPEQVASSPKDRIDPPQAAQTPSVAEHGDAATETKPTTDVASATETPSADDHTTRKNASGKWVQLGALKDKKAAEASWGKIQHDNEDLLKSVGHAVRRADLGPDRGVFFRLRAGPFNSTADAQTLCSSLKSRNIACFVVTI